MIFYSLCSTCTCPWCRPTSRKHKSSMSAFKASTGRNKQQSKRLRLKIGYHKKSAGESSSFRQCSHMFSLRLPVVGYIPHSLTQPYRPRPKFFANIATFFICFFSGIGMSQHVLSMSSCVQQKALLCWKVRCIGHSLRYLSFWPSSQHISWMNRASAHSAHGLTCL